MRKVLFVLLSLILLGSNALNSQTISRKAMLDSLKSIDPEVKKYFPRWKICEPDLQIQIYKTFLLLGYSESELDQTQIEVLAIPRLDPYEPYEILTINCGKSFMTASEIESNMGLLVDFISGADSYLYPGNPPEIPTREYCYEDIPPEIPLTENQAAAIMDYLEPSNVTHAFSLSLFDQSLKIGESMFWLKSEIGTDPVGYPFWTAGEAKVVLKRPLYLNTDANTSTQIPQLINLYIGGGYRIKNGLEDQSGIFEFLPNRILNGASSGKIIAGFDFHMPFYPYAGIHFNCEAPITTDKEFTIDKKAYGKIDVPTTADGRPLVMFDPDGIHSMDELKYVVPVLQTTGQVSLFYNLWINKDKPENFFRFDLGLSYSEVQEYAYFEISDKDEFERKKGYYLTTKDVQGLKLYKPSEFMDWLYAKFEFRNQATFPFGFSVQYSNQIFLGRVYVPLFSPWLYLEAKYATPLRDARPYEIEHFFMISPVLRIVL